MVWDVAIIGLGTMGSMASWQLSKRNISVIGFEQFGIGHDYAGAGGESRLFRVAYKEGEQYVPLLKRAKKLWRQLENETGNKLLINNGGLTIGTPENKVIKNVINSAKNYDIQHEILDYYSAKKKYPQHKISNQEIMFLDKEAGALRPELAVVSALSRAEKLGATINTYTPVTSIEKSGDKVIIEAEGRTYTANQVLVTTGSWFSSLLPQYKSIVRPNKIILSWFAAYDINKFKPQKFPIFTRTVDNHKFYGGPTLDNSMVKISVSNKSLIETPDELNRNINIEEIEENIEIVKKYFNGLYSHPVRLDAYTDAYTVDNHSLIGRMPNFQNCVVAGGFSGHGFKMSPAIGEQVTNILLDQNTELDITSLSPYRFIE